MKNNQKIKIKYVEEFRETLIHEIGHFVTSIFMKEQFVKHSVKRIEIKEDDIRFKYGGETITENEEFDKVYTSREFITLKLANLYQGCIFQSIYSNNKYSFTTCLDNHGTVDNYYASGILSVFKSPDKREAIIDLINDFVSQMNNNSEIFKDVFSIDLVKHIKHDNKRGEYLIDLDMLENTLSPFIKKYEIYFKDFVSSLSKILYPN